MGKPSRDKGKRGEAEVGHLLDFYDVPYVREQDGRTQGFDFRFYDVGLEVRRRERILICQWSREAEEKAATDLVPAVAYRTNGEPWRVSMRMSDWIEGQR